MTPAERDRFEKCSPWRIGGPPRASGEAARAAAERIAAGAGLTLTEAAASPAQSAVLCGGTGAAAPAAALPAAALRLGAAERAVKPITVEELRRQKAETEAWKKRAAASAELKRKRERAEQEAYAAEQRAAQAERDREWAAAQARRKAP